MRIYIVGEDVVTFAVIRRVLEYCSPDFEIIIELPARGGKVKSKISEFNTLSEKNPVVLLIDLDSNVCAPQLMEKSIKDKNDNFIFNVAVDEAEAWLMADRDGFSSYFKIKINDMPSAKKTKQGGNKSLIEMDFTYKSSMYLTTELIKKSKNQVFIEQLTPKKNAAKGPQYNECILPFIQNVWNIDKARKNSDSLNRMIMRIEKLKNKII